MSAAIRSLVARHADGLDDAAAALAKDNIGLATNGHVALLRRIAASMRADAARGVLPHSYNDSMYASAATASLPLPVLHDLRAAGLESLAQDGETITLQNLNASFAETPEIDVSRKLRIKGALLASGKLTD
jgi:hypothetical protein